MPIRPRQVPVNNTGTYEPDVLIKNTFTAPAAYVYTARMRTNDDDMIGIVWNYQDPNNYFRAGIRQQAAAVRLAAPKASRFRKSSAVW